MAALIFSALALQFKLRAAFLTMCAVLLAHSLFIGCIISAVFESLTVGLLLCSTIILVAYAVKSRKG